MDGSLRDRVDEAVAACDRGDFNAARKTLEAIAVRLGGADKFPARALSAYGLSLAATEKKKASAGEQFCRRALEKDMVDGGIYLDLARLYLITGSKRRAVQTLDQGLRAEPEHHGLQRLRVEIGQRKGPPLPFLDRGHPLNRMLGKIRHTLVGGGKAAKKQAKKR